MSTVYFDCAQGASAALMLCALSAAREAGHAAPDAYRLPRGIRLRCIHALDGDEIGRSVELELPQGQRADEELPMAELEELVSQAELRPGAAERAGKVLSALARAYEETRPSARRSLPKRHRGLRLDAAAALIALAEKLDALGVDEICYSPVNAGGRVPGAEITHMAAEGGMRMFMTPGAGELLTVEGAAVLTALGRCQSPALVPEACGRGFGEGGAEMSALIGQLDEQEESAPGNGEESVLDNGDTSASANCETPSSGNAEPCASGNGATPDVVVIECNIDDMPPEQLACACERLMEEGALDVWQTPIVMKKGRLAAQLSVLCACADAERLAGIVLRETTTLGVRMAGYSRRVLPRTVRTVDTRFGPIRVKCAPGKLAPEYEDCRKAARASGAALGEVYEAARGAAETR